MERLQVEGDRGGQEVSRDSPKAPRSCDIGQSLRGVARVEARQHGAGVVNVMCVGASQDATAWRRQIVLSSGSVSVIWKTSVITWARPSESSSRLVRSPSAVVLVYPVPLTTC